MEENQEWSKAKEQKQASIRLAQDVMEPIAMGTLLHEQ